MGETNIQCALVKIAYVLNTYPAPSHSFIRREIRALEARGVEVRRIAMRPHDGPLADAGDRDEAARTDYVLARGAGRLLGSLGRAFLAHPGGTLAALGQALRLGRRSEAGMLKHLVYWLEAAHVARLAQAQGAERLHAHFGTNAATVAMLAQPMGAPPYSFTIHGPEEFDKPGLIGLTEKLERAEFAVAISSYGRSQLCRLVHTRHWPKLKVVHCGIEPAAFPDFAPMPPARPLRLVCVGRFAEQKGLPVLIDAMAEVNRRGMKVELALVGDGPLRTMLERRIAHHQLQGVVRLTGWLDEEGVRDQIARAHAMVLPSFAEGLPVVLMEAMATGRPVIATYIAGIPELVQPGRNGWLVPAGDTEALAAAIIEMALTPPETLAKMGKGARARALTRHNVAAEAEKLAGHFAQRPRTQPD